jgi:hypothetical protein
MTDILVANIFQICTLLIAMGVFINQSKTTKELVTEQGKRLEQVEKQAASSALLLSRVGITLDRLDLRFEAHEKDSPCVAHTTTLKFIHEDQKIQREEIGRLRERVEEVERG